MCTMFTRWLKVGMSDMQEWMEEVLEPSKSLFLCFSLCMFKFYDRVRKQSLQLLNLNFFGIFYSKFQLVLTFPFAVTFCWNWLPCCDLICKWVTCRSGCKRFWKSALHILLPNFAFVTVTQRSGLKKMFFKKSSDPSPFLFLFFFFSFFSFLFFFFSFFFCTTIGANN